MKVELDQSIDFAKVLFRAGASALVVASSNLIPADAKAQNCLIPSAPQNYTIDIESNTSSSSNDAIPNKDSSPLAHILWPSVPGADRYNFRLVRKDSQTEQRPPDRIIDNWTGNIIEVHLPYPLSNPQSYSGWVHSVNDCGVSNPTGFTFEVTNTNITNPKPSPIGSH